MSVDLSRQLIDRLERLSADSAWAHQASGVKGTLLRHLDQMKAGEGKRNLEKIDDIELESLDHIIKIGFDILNKAAAEIKVVDHELHS
jgi:hypothetical protein